MKITKIGERLYSVGDQPPSRHTIEYAQRVGIGIDYLRIVGTSSTAEAVAFINDRAAAINQCFAAKPISSVSSDEFQWRQTIHGPRIHEISIIAELREAVVHWLRFGTFDGVIANEGEQGV